VEFMTNGEERIRIWFPDGSKAVHVYSPLGGWGDSGSSIRRDGEAIVGTELLVIQLGWAAIAYFGDDRSCVALESYKVGESAVLHAERAHNVYLTLGARVTAVMQGDWRDVTRQAEPALDALTHPLDWKEILARTLRR
jgi:hypothetical protein